MCGLAGFLAEQGVEKNSVKHCLNIMGNALNHRGPDDKGDWFDDNVGLVHRRLSIHDLTTKGHQPMISPNGRFVFVYNGEIYNFKELKRDLSALGAIFLSNSDTEVFLSAIEAWGLEKALHRVVGMFAVALWDRREKVLTLARDRMGEKPIYYGWQGTGNNRFFLFGSELKALRVHPSWQGGVERGAVAHLLRYNYIPAKQTIHPKIYKLLPGHLLRLTRKNSKWQERTEMWWSLQNVIEQALESPYDGDIEQATDVLDSLLCKVINDQRVADVPLGAFLSGGIDSSVVVGMMQKLSSQSVQTFTIGYDNASYDESTHAKDVAQHIGTNHTEWIISTKDIQSIIPNLASIYDEPFADASQLPTVLLSQLAHRHVTVSLSGDGGDELFAGYNRHLWAPVILSKMNKVPRILRRVMARMLVTPSPNSWDNFFNQSSHLPSRYLKMRQPGEKIHRIASILNASGEQELYSRLVRSWNEPVPVLGEHSVNIADNYETLWNMGKSFADRMTYLDAVTYLPDDVLVKLDRATMSSSLETRVPFLDHRIVEFAASLPLSMKIHDGEGKWVLRRVLERYVPRNLTERPKTGFGMPLNEWLRGSLRDWADDLLSEQRLREDDLFDVAVIRDAWKKHLSGKYNLQYQLWSVLMFQAWNQSR